jgi:RHS repeat-associated protein
MFWERGNLLKEYRSAGNNNNQTATYSYNNQGVRFEKQFNGSTTKYYHDGAKLLAESRSGGNDIAYIYDAEEIVGFFIEMDFQRQPFFYIKDAQGNVIAIVNNSWEMARYEYDAWGNCRVVSQRGGIGDLNPIRWKSQYYDVESGLYYIDGRYYSPLMKQYISAVSPEEAMANAGTIGAVYPYTLTIANPVSMMYNGYTIETNVPLAFDPPALTRTQFFWSITWPEFWRSPAGRILAVKLFVVILVFIIVTKGAGTGLVFAAFTALSLAIGATVAGFRAKDNGDDFWEGFKDYITNNWAQSIAIGAVLFVVTAGIGKLAKAALIKAGSAKPLASAVASDKIRVGQWMSKVEYQQFSKTGIIPRSNVLTKGMEGFMAQAAKGDFYVEFLMQKSLLASKDPIKGWWLIKSKNSMHLKLAQMKGSTLPDPVGWDIIHIATKPF